MKPGRKTVRLTSSQVAIAKKLGVPLEEYAKQINSRKERNMKKEIQKPHVRVKHGHKLKDQKCGLLHTSLDAPLHLMDSGTVG